LESLLSSVFWMPREIRIERTGFGPHDAAAKVARKSKVLLKTIELRATYGFVAVAEIDVASEYGDLNAVAEESVAGVDGKILSETAGVGIETGDRLGRRKLDGFEVVASDLRGEFCGGKFAEIVSSYTEFHRRRKKVRGFAARPEMEP